MLYDPSFQMCVYVLYISYVNVVWSLWCSWLLALGCAWCQVQPRDNQIWILNVSKVNFLLSFSLFMHSNAVCNANKHNRFGHFIHIERTILDRNVIHFVVLNVLVITTISSVSYAICIELQALICYYLKCIRKSGIRNGFDFPISGLVHRPNLIMYYIQYDKEFNSTTNGNRPTLKSFKSFAIIQSSKPQLMWCVSNVGVDTELCLKKRFDGLKHHPNESKETTL